MVITRGTTPTVSLTVKDFEVSASDEIHLYFSQKNKMRFKKTSTDNEITVEETAEGIKVITTLTQEDTFMLKKGDVKLQFRVKLNGDGPVLASGEVHADVQDVDDDDEVI